MMTMMMALLLGAAAPAAIPAPLTANEAPETSLRLPIKGYDFSRTDDVERFDRRARIAVNDYCGTASSADLAGQNRVKQCRAEAHASITAQRNQRIAAATRIRPALAQR